MTNPMTSGFRFINNNSNPNLGCQCPNIKYFFLNLFPKEQILDSSHLKQFADDNFKLDENGRNVSKWVENTVGKGEIDFSFSHRVLKGLVLQTRKNQGLFGKGLEIEVHS